MLFHNDQVSNSFQEQECEIDENENEKISFIPLIFIFLTVSMIISYKEFRIWNPFVPLNGIVRVSALGEEYYEIQEYPKIIIANKKLKLEN